MTDGIEPRTILQRCGLIIVSPVGGTMEAENQRQSRLKMARAAAFQLLDALESGAAPVSQSLMRAKRLSRLLRDKDAQAWLDLEMKGYPSDFAFSSLGSCQRYAVEGGRVSSGGNYYSQSLPRIEAESQAAKSALTSGRPADAPVPPVSGFVAANATLKVLSGVAQQQADLRSAYTIWTSLLASMCAAIHSYASDVNLALELGDVAENIFEAARRDVDVFVRSHCPAAVQQLLSITERMRDSDAESLSAALTSCRRLLASVADAVFPPSDEKYVDGKSRRRKVGPDEYKNRLLAYVEQTVTSSGSRTILSTNIEHLAARLDAVYEKACKGVHVDVSIDEARLAVIGTYLLVAEVARVTADGLPSPSTQAAQESDDDMTDKGEG